MAYYIVCVLMTGNIQCHGAYKSRSAAAKAWLSLCESVYIKEAHISVLDR